MIHTVWSGLHAPIRRQISPNHASWDTFSSALRDLKLGIETTPTSLPIPWHRCYLPIHIPYQIGNTPSHSGLVLKITRHMPELFRGRDPDPSQQKKRSKARSISPAHSHVSDSDDEDIDTTIVLETEILTLDDEKEQVNYRELHGARTDFSRYFWPQYALPVLSDRAYSAVGAMQSAGMKLTGLVYNARKTIMNLGTVFVEFEPLLHTSPQIYTRKQWNGVMQVPTECIGELLKRKRKVMKLLMSLVDPIYNYSAWCLYTVEWLRQIFREGPEQLTLLEALSAPGRQPFRGLGRYGANEVLSIAGIPGWTLLSVIVADKVLFSVICEAFFQFVSVRALKAEEYYRMSRATSTEDMLDD
ncbi:hypothetical protein B0H10DRAFT_1954836 [Mycena sp. CBHHK59/15]|nr:hypothetical protein B0H10DRAFT_1954836 [Mycena sp. CBHHK59/15]